MANQQFPQGTFSPHGSDWQTTLSSLYNPMQKANQFQPVKYGSFAEFLASQQPARDSWTHGSPQGFQGAANNYWSASGQSPSVGQVGNGSDYGLGQNNQGYVYGNPYEMMQTQDNTDEYSTDPFYLNYLFGDY